MKPVDKRIAVRKIFLDLKNPRHEPFDSQEEAIAYLCKAEGVYNLAKDIVKYGINPMDRFGVVSHDSSKTAYVVVEGNRRLCALKLLNDPDIAPSSYRKRFEKLSNQWAPIGEVPCVVFNHEDDAKIWLERIHDGEQEGRGRKGWNADQKQRFSGSGKNKTALDILDYAQKKGFIVEEDRKGKLTTVQRYVGNRNLQSALGIEVGDLQVTLRVLSEDDFDKILRKFLSDLLAGEVHSRNNKTEIEAYARRLASFGGGRKKQINPEPLDADGEAQVKPSKVILKDQLTSQRKIKPKKPDVHNIKFDDRIFSGLERIGSSKLSSLYYSLCDLRMGDHAVLLYVGAWVFIESLSARMGRNDGTAFPSYFAPKRLESLGFKDKNDRRALTEALERISTSGNNTKHHSRGGSFDGPQLVNDMETLGDLIVCCIGEIEGSIAKNSLAENAAL